MKRLKWIIPLVIIAFCAFGFLFAPHDPYEMNSANQYATFSSTYPLGTDRFGRCEFSRLLYGGRSTLGIVLTGAAIVLIIGTIIGLWIGWVKAAHNIFLAAFWMP